MHDLRAVGPQVKNAKIRHARGTGVGGGTGEVSMKHDYPVLEADVLVIGGGSAGAMAAIRAKEGGP